MNGQDNTLPRVVKIGGSLFDLDELPQRLSRVLAGLGRAPLALVAGGGAVADVIREWDRRFSLGPSRSHWMAIQSLNLSGEVLRASLPESVFAGSWDEVTSAWHRGEPAVLAIDALLRNALRSGETVPPESWDVTSDSLAAWAAKRLGARLLLVKSVDRPSGTAAEAASAGLVDAWFPRAVDDGLSVDWINLRQAEPTIQHWLSPGSPALQVETNASGGQRR
jgi:aspartokinase-like uncharacterized kinase